MTHPAASASTLGWARFLSLLVALICVQIVYQRQVTAAHSYYNGFNNLQAIGQQQQQPPIQQQQQQLPQMPPQKPQAQDEPQPAPTPLDLGAQPMAQHPKSLEPIFRLEGHALNSSTVKLVWNLQMNHPADWFEIDWGPIPDVHTFRVRLNGTARDHTFHQLQPDTDYQFQLRGYLAEHAYKPLLKMVHTPPANYQAPKSYQEVNRDIMPLGVKAEAKSNNSVQLSWIEAEKPASIRNSNRVNIIRYYVNPTLPANNSQASETSANVNNNQLPTAPQYYYLNVTNARESRLIVQKLKPATEYAFAVKTAYYSPDMKKIFSQSGFSMDTVARTHDLEPTAPRNFTIQEVAPTREESLAGQTVGSKLELSWAPPEASNGQLKGYVILHSHEANAPEARWQKIDVNDSSLNSWYLYGLKPGLSYYFKVRALNQRGAGPDSETRPYVAPVAPPVDRMTNAPIPASNVLLLLIICMMAILFLLSLCVWRLACNTGRKARKGSLNAHQTSGQQKSTSGEGLPKLNGFASNNLSSTVAARVGTLARRRDNSSNKPDFWISAMDQQPESIKSNISEKSNSDLNMAMVSIQRDSPQFATTQLAPALPEYRFTEHNNLLQQLAQQQPAQGHYHPAHHQFGATSPLAFDQMDNATASALMTLSKRQQQQLQKYQIQFASTGVPPSSTAAGQQQTQAPSPHQQPPPPPPLNIEQQQQQQQHYHLHNQPLYGTHQPGSMSRSLRLHRPTLYDPVSGSFQQSEAGPPNYNTHHVHPTSMLGASTITGGVPGQITSSTLQFHPHQTSTLLSRRSTNTLRSFQTAGSTYGQLQGFTSGNNNTSGQQQFSFGQPPSSIGSNSQPQQPQQLLQSHQAVINQLNNSTYPSLPLKHVSAVRPQIMSSLEDQIEMELAEKGEQEQQQQQQQQASQAIKQ